MAIQDDLDTPLAKAVRILGGQTALGRLIDVDQSTVHDWLRDDRPLPAEHLIVVCEATGLQAIYLRPDLAALFQNPPLPSPVEGTVPAEAPRNSAGTDSAQELPS